MEVWCGAEVWWGLPEVLPEGPIGRALEGRAPDSRGSPRGSPWEPAMVDNAREVTSRGGSPRGDLPGSRPWSTTLARRFSLEGRAPSMVDNAREVTPRGSPWRPDQEARPPGGRTARRFRPGRLEAGQRPRGDPPRERPGRRRGLRLREGHTRSHWPEGHSRVDNPGRSPAGSRASLKLSNYY